jgi:hypothetical protein
MTNTSVYSKIVTVLRVITNAHTLAALVLMFLADESSSSLSVLFMENA